MYNEKIDLSTPMSNQDRISSYNIIWWELRRIQIRGLLVDPVPNSPNWHLGNCLADSEEKY